LYVLPDLALFATICNNGCDNGWIVFLLKVLNLQEGRERSGVSLRGYAQSSRKLSTRQVHGESTIIGANNILAKLRLIAGEDADAPPSTGNRHVPLLLVGRGLDGRIREQDVIDGLALRRVRRDGETANKAPVMLSKNPSVSKPDLSVCIRGIAELH
jgi:hypothetical protein